MSPPEGPLSSLHRRRSRVAYSYRSWPRKARKLKFFQVFNEIFKLLTLHSFRAPHFTFPGPGNGRENELDDDDINMLRQFPPENNQIVCGVSSRLCVNRVFPMTVEKKSFRVTYEKCLTGLKDKACSREHATNMGLRRTCTHANDVCVYYRFYLPVLTHLTWCD